MKLEERRRVVGNDNEIEKRLWDAADQLRANSHLKSSEYSVPVLGLIFLRYADHKFSQARMELEGKSSRRRTIGKVDYQAKGVVYLPEKARFSNLLRLPEGANIGKAINEAMRQIEEENEDLKDVLPKNYGEFDNDLLVALLKNFSEIPLNIEGDSFGRIYEYFLGEFAMGEGARGGEFYTPTSIVRLIVEVIEPYHGRILDPACGSGGMFVQSAKFVERRKKNPSAEISIYGQEKTKETVRLCKMNLAVHGLSGDIKESNTYYEDVHKSVGRFDFVMANPPFNVDRVDKDKLLGDPRYPLGVPTADNANYLWIQIFYSALAKEGRAGFVMANSACDARGSELEIRRKMIQKGVVDAIVSVGPNFFYTVTLPVTLWFLDKGKSGSSRKDQILFIDVRSIFRQIDRAHRDWTPDQIDMIANIVRLYRGESPVFQAKPDARFKGYFGDGGYTDVPGLCKVAGLREIERQGWSLSPTRYVGGQQIPRANSISEQLDAWLVDAQRRLREIIAAAEYQRWFVEFKFPGHESVRLVDSVIGKIPQGWKTVRLGELIELRYGKALKESQRRPGEVPVYGSSGIIGWHDEPLVDGPGIIVGRKGNVGSVHWSDSPFYPIDTTFFVETSLPMIFVYHTLKNHRFENKDAAVPGLGRNQAYEDLVLLPPEPLLASFDKVVEESWQEARDLLSSNIGLRRIKEDFIERFRSDEARVERR